MSASVEITEALENAALFGPTARALARLLQEFDPASPPEVRLGGALACEATVSGHVCFDLPSFAGLPWSPRGEGDGPSLSLPPLEEWLAALKGASVVGAPGDFTPLVLDAGGRLYLHRYWEFQRALAADIVRLGEGLAPDVDLSLLTDGVGRLFGEEGDPGQKRAALCAVLKRFALISGGPGTGKTTTVVKVLALLLEQGIGTDGGIALAAPTGKAAARLQESIASARERLDSPQAIRSMIPAEVSTLHRLLGLAPGRSGIGRTRENPLRQKVVVVDEASMVDLPMMARLTAALPPDGRLVLLGDRHQLASVEAGAVLAEICTAGGSPLSAPFFDAASVCGLSPEAAAGGATRSALGDGVAFLDRSFRFTSDSGIGRVCAAVNRGDAPEALTLLGTGGYRDLAWQECAASEVADRLLPLALEGFAPLRAAASPEEALERLGRFMVLCALREGPFGAAGVNRLIERGLRRSGLIRGSGPWYHGQPLMVTRNDYRLGVFNGDVGVVWSDGEGAPLRVCFPDPAGGVRSLPPQRLPAWESAHAMTVHKSQGSEFDRVVLLLPDRGAAVVTRELLYTGLSRARQHVTVMGSRAPFADAVGRCVVRSSGLGEELSSLQGGGFNRQGN